MGILVAVQSACRLAQTQFLGLLVQFFNDDSQPVRNGYVFRHLAVCMCVWYVVLSLKFAPGCSAVIAHVVYCYINRYLYALGLVLTAAGIGILHHQFFFKAWRIGMQIRSSITALVYGKALRLQLSSLSQTSTGQIVNLMTNDIERFQKIGQFSHFLWLGPLESGVVTWLLYREIEWAAFGGLALLFLLIPLQAWFSKRFGKLRSATARLTDERVRVTGQALGGARVMKMYGWERPFVATVAAIRKLETKRLNSVSWLRSFNEGLFMVSPILIAYVSFVIFVQGLDGHLTSRIIFTTLSLFNMVQMMMTKFFPLAVESTSECVISSKRLMGFLLLKERDLTQQHADADATDAHLKHLQSRMINPKDDDSNGSNGKINETNASTDDNNTASVTGTGTVAATVAAAATTPAPGSDGHGWVVLRNVTVAWDIDRPDDGDTHADDRSRQPSVSTGPSPPSLGHPNPVASPSHRERNPSVDTHTSVPGAGSHPIVARAPSVAGMTVDSTGRAVSRVADGRLYDLCMTAAPGQLLMVAGPVGSGKSSLLYTLLGELDPVLPEGTAKGGSSGVVMTDATGQALPAAIQASLPSAGGMYVGGRVAYAAQEPWIISGTVRSNIVFGSEFDQVRYDASAKACCLDVDLMRLDYGDMTRIGERGITLSGGQKARIGLARAVVRQRHL